MALTLDPENRLGYSGNLQKTIENVCTFYDLGKLVNTTYLAEGYEDCNIKLQTERGIYVCKLFADNQLGDYSKTRRGNDVADRLIEIILAVQTNGANTPQLIKGAGRYLFKENELVALTYEWIDGTTYYDLNRAPNNSELDHIIEQAALINTTSIQPVYYHDIWAVPHIHELFKKVEQYLTEKDVLLLNKVLDRFDAISLDDLPKCLVHGDLTKGNVLLSNDQKPFIIDYSVTNWSTRLIELTLIVSNLLYDEKDKRTLSEKSKLVSEMYQKYNSLTQVEINALPDLSLAGSAMEFLGGIWRQNFLNDDSEETKYWLGLGRQTLLREL